MGLEWSGNWGEGSGIRGDKSVRLCDSDHSVSPHIVHCSRRFRVGSFASSSSSFLTAVVVAAIMINLYLKRGKWPEPFNCVPLTLKSLSFPLTFSTGC